MAPDKQILQKVVDSLKNVGEFDVNEISVCDTSAVYKAVEKKVRKALVIKLMPVAQWGDKAAAALATAANERKIVRGFDHPNLPRMLSGGEFEGHLFWICDFVDGVQLKNTIEKGETLKSLDLVDMARQLCASLEYTSKSGIVHHRFTPSNLIIEWDGGAKLLDWGVPSYPDLGPNASERTLKSAHYLSPEQLAGQTGDYRSSLFSVGVILHQLATGRLPFVGEDIASLRAAMEGSARTLVEHDKRIPAGISVPIMKLLAKDPSQRYKSGPEFIKELENFKKYGQKDELPANFIQKPSNSGFAGASAGSGFGGGNGAGFSGGTGGGFGALESDWSQSSWKPAMSAAPKVETMSAQDSAVAVAPLPPVEESAKLVKETVYEDTKVVEAPKPKVALPKVDPKKVGKQVGNAVMKEAKKIPPLAAVITVAALFFIFLAWRAVVPYLITNHSNTPVVDPDIPNLKTDSQPAQQQPAQPQSVDSVQQIPAQQDAAASDSQPAPEPVATSGRASARNRKATGKSKFPALAAPIAAQYGEVSVTTEPSGAEFQIDGKSDGRYVTPATIGLIAPGKHVITVSKAGYRTESMSADVTAGSRASVITRLVRAGSMISVGSTPTGGAIFVDGRDTGKVTPAQVSIPSGQHAVSVKAEGYLEYNSTVTVAEGQSQALAPILVPLGRVTEIKVKKGGLFGMGKRADKDMGTVSIRTTPPGAVVMVNGQMAPKATPLEFSLNPGGYELVFQLTGYKSAKKSIVVEAGAKNNVDVTLEQ